MRSRRVIASLAVVFAVLAAAFLPMVPYSVPFSIPYNASLEGFAACRTYGYSSDQFLTCLRPYEFPPAMISGYSTVFYALTGFGSGPFPQTLLVTQTNLSALVHMSGTKVEFYEGPLPRATTLNPSNVVKVENVSVTQWAFGRLNFSARITNLGEAPIWSPGVSFAYPTYGENRTLGNLTSYTAPGSSCATILPAGATCTGSILLPQSPSLLTGQSYPMVVEVTSFGAASNASGYQQPFVYLYRTSVSYPGTGLNPYWVQAFIQAVNEKRNATALTENSTLDTFAATRYNTMRAQYDISDYNFTNDLVHYFGTFNANVFEEILYPSGMDPATFPDYLHDKAIGHWQGLMNPAYSQYGYFFGTGPTVVVGPSCSVSEVPGPNINITQYVIDNGCSYIVADQIWFIIILSG